MREVDGLDIDHVKVVGQARVGTVRRSFAVREGDRLDEVVVGLLHNDAELSLPA